MLAIPPDNAVEKASRTANKIKEFTDPDCSLMMQVANNDTAAFEQLVRRHYDRVCTMLFHEIGHEHVAEELAQEVFFRVYNARSRYVPTAKFSTWLFTITRNLAFNAKRGIARRHEVQFDVDKSLADHCVSNALSGIDALRAKEANGRIYEAIEKLGDRQRKALVLSRFHRMSYDEIAAEMCLSPTAVKSLLSRARGRLRQMLDSYFASP